MKIKKKHFFQLHSWIGTRLSILFFIVCFSGTLATLSHETDWLFNPAIRATPRESFASRNLTVSNLEKKYPEARITYWERLDAPYLCDILYLNENDQLSYAFANPYTGEIQGRTQLTFQRFFRDLHYYLFIPFQVGHFVVLIFGFLLLISLVTALFFYKKWWRKLFELQRGKGKLMLFRSLHRLVGLWSVPFTILFSITGIWYFMERTNTAGIYDAGNPPPPEISRDFKIPETEKPASYLFDYDKAKKVAENEIPGLKVGDIIPPHDLNSPAYLTGYSQEPLVRQRANRVYLDPVTYEVIKVQKASEIGMRTWLNDIADPLHFGSWGGLVTKVIWFIFGLGISSLVLTGIWITLKRTAAKRKKNRKPVMGIWTYINWGIYAVFLGFMYHILITRYDVNTATLVYISLGWLVFIFLSYYLFIYRLNKSISRT